MPSGAGHPPTAVPVTEVRPTEIQTAPVPAPELIPVDEPVRLAPPKKELVLFVGGYGSRGDDGAFDELAARFPPDRYVVRRLGDDPRFPYDTYGGIDANAKVLTDQIRNIAKDYSAVNIVSHSMGGAVTDRAFRNGLSAADGVRTFVAIGGPHSGADFARAPAFLLPVIGPIEGIVRAVGLALAHDPSSDAIRDLAVARPIRPPARVVRVDASLATDGLVNEYDAQDPGVPQRVFLPATPRELIDGHGGSLVNRQIGDLVVETIRTHAVPPDRRDPITKFLAPIIWDQETRLWRKVLVVVVAVAVIVYAARAVPILRDVIDGLNAWGRRLVHSFGR